jgi:hypothetical protein
MKNKKMGIIIFFFVIITPLYSTPGNIDRAEEIYEKDEFILHGLTFSGVFFQDLSFGFGYNVLILLPENDYFYWAYANLSLEYKTSNEIFIRNYYHINFMYFIVFGFSIITKCYNNFDIGFSPDIGLEFPLIWPYFMGSIETFYRYNILKNYKNNHEIGLRINLYDLKLFSKLKKSN